MAPLQPPLELAVQHVVDQRALARSRDTGDRGERPERNADVDAVEIVQRGAAQRKPGRGGGTAGAGDADPLPAGEIVAGERVGGARHRARMDEAPAVFAGAGTEFDHPVGAADRGEIVLDHHQGVAEIAQPAEERQQAVVVAGVQPDRRLVEHVHGVDEMRTEGVRECNALRLPARQRTRLAVEGQVAETDVAQVRHPCPGFGQHQIGHAALRLAKRQAFQPAGDGVDRVGGDVGDRTAGHRDRQRFRTQPRAAAVGAFVGQLILPQEDADVLLVPLALQVLEEGHDPHEPPRPAGQQGVAHLLRQVAPRGVDIGAELLGGGGEEPAASVVARLGPGIDRALGDAPPGIGHDQRQIVFQHRTEAVAGGARATGIVEREECRCHRRRRRVAPAARRVLGEALAPAVLAERRCHAFPLVECGRHRFADPVALFGHGFEPVNHDQHLAGGVQVGSPGQFVEVDAGAVDHDTDESEGAEIVHRGGVGHPGGGGKREGDLQPARSRRDDRIGGRLWRVATHRSAADDAGLHADARPQEPQEVVHLGSGPDSGARRHRRWALFDGHSGREPFDPVDQRLRHPLEELLGVRRERFDVAPLSLGVERVEGERTLPRAGRTGHHGQRAARDLDGDVLEVVLPCTDHTDHEAIHG